jgi:hypothetical protein
MSITGGYLVQGDRFRLYQEMFDGENVHLRLEEFDFSASPNVLTIKIPKEIWEVLRQKGFDPKYYHFESDEDGAIVTEEEEGENQT